MASMKEKAQWERLYAHPVILVESYCNKSVQRNQKTGEGTRSVIMG